MEDFQEHIPVLKEEVLSQFSPRAEDVLLDATLGHGGHAKAYLTISPTARVIGLDADEEALAAARNNLSAWADQVVYIHSNFARLAEVVPSDVRITHVLFDLGIGSHQLADSKRGFAFQGAGALTMRYGQQEGLPPAMLEPLNILEQRLGALPDAMDVLHRLDYRELAQLIRMYGEEKMASRVAGAIKNAPLPQTAQELAAIITSALPSRYERGRIHPATRTFQALRLAVNRELEALQAALPQAMEVLQPNGKLAVISFHSLEDRIVKRFFREQARICVCPPEQPVCTCDRKPRLHIETKKPIVATEGEVVTNPRARSAKLRVATKLPP
ncbi:MAG: 16S rRNA (cytosine(1402)-N(4))-methyltransferase RsmH [Candidatus Andersenbacteria bacterium]